MRDKKELVRLKKEKLRAHRRKKVDSSMKRKAELVLHDTKEEIPTFSKEFDEREYTTAFGLMAELVQYIEMGDILSRIDPDKKYVVEIPAMFKDDLQLEGKPMQEVAATYHNIYTQRELAYIATTVEKTYKQVEKIEHGQMDDRIAKLQSGREQILLAMTLKDEDEKKDAVRLGRHNMLEAKNQIGKALERRVREFEPLPKERMKLLMKQVRDSDYLNGKDDEVEEIQNYYNLYLEATKLLTASYVYSGEEDAARQVAMESKKFMKNIDFKNIKSIERIHQNEDLDDMFFNAPVEYLEIEEKEILDNNHDKSIMIEVDGAELLEVLNNEPEEIQE